MSDILKTERLVLRPLRMGDAEEMTALIGDFDVSKNLTVVKHPYALSDAQEFLETVQRLHPLREAFVFAIRRAADDVFMGVMAVEFSKGGFHLGYWLGRPYWAKGYATEAGRAVVRFTFETLAIGHLLSGWYFDNPASGRVLEKLGFAANGADERNCLSRGTAVLCHNVVLTREAYERQQVKR